MIHTVLKVWSLGFETPAHQRRLLIMFFPLRRGIIKIIGAYQRKKSYLPLRRRPFMKK